MLDPVRHPLAMHKNDPDVEQRKDGSLWLKVDADSPLRNAVSEVEVVRERQRWMAAPKFSRNRFQAKPAQRKIGIVRALIIMLRDSLRPRDDIAERLYDIEQLILAGQNDRADLHIEKLRADYPTEEMKARVLGLYSLNLYDRGNAGKAQYIHEFALLCGTAHPVMTEIFGESVRAPLSD
ncbi:hypothetical protein [Sphingorhabdus contaminans]|uniref:hypothetical protein n=1 Tax=Sphingorhabdus contaminans TaxID=1343899 RepID=UPI003D274810